MLDGDNVFSCSASIILNNNYYVKRPHIHNLLQESVQKPITIVTAGAGYGKTQAVYAFLKKYDAATLWVKLTVLDNISTRLWRNVVNSISSYNKKVATQLESFGFPDSTVKLFVFLSHISESMLSGKKYVIVFDDFHLIHEKTILRFVERVANACITDLSIILISRNEPEINIAGLSDKGMLSIINEEDLCFSKSDIARYYEMQDIHASRQLISKIYKNTAGWIMAIHLVGIAIKKGVAHEDYAITAMKHNIFRLIESEVFSDIPENVQEFLIKLSLFNSLPLELVQLLSVNDNQLITSILNITSFIHYDSFSNVFCIHHVFLDFLTQKQSLLSRDEREVCFRKAADWAVSNGYIIDAITYYEKINGYREILKFALIFPYGSPEEAALVLNILERAPEEAYEREPLLVILHARALWFVGSRKEYMNELYALVNKYEALPQTTENLLVLCELYFNLGLSSYYLACTDVKYFIFSDYFSRAYKCISRESVMLNSRYIQEVGSYVCRISSEKKEDMERYITAVDIATSYAPKIMQDAMRGLDDLTHAELAYFKNDMKISERFAYQAFYKAREAQQHIIKIRAVFYLMRISLAAGNNDKILDLMKLFKTENFSLPNSQTLYDIVTGWFYSVIGQDDKVANWIKSNFDHEDLSLIASGLENLAKIKCCLSGKKYHDFLIFWENQKHEYGINGINAFLFGKIAMTATKAVCLYRINEKSEALKTLQEAYELAKPNSLTMQFIELGNDMVSLTRFALKSGDCLTPEEWLSDICRKASTYAKRISYVASEYKRLHAGFQPKLTKKEREFLKEICHGMSGTEIANNYGLSPSYVKSKLQTIYTKIGAKNLRDAIRIATLMDLIE